MPRSQPPWLAVALRAALIPPKGAPVRTRNRQRHGNDAARACQCSTTTPARLPRATCWPWCDQQGLSVPLLCSACGRSPRPGQSPPPRAAGLPLAPPSGVRPPRIRSPRLPARPAAFTPSSTTAIWWMMSAAGMGAWRQPLTVRRPPPTSAPYAVPHAAAAAARASAVPSRDAPQGGGGQHRKKKTRAGSTRRPARARRGAPRGGGAPRGASPCRQTRF